MESRCEHLSRWDCRPRRHASAILAQTAGAGRGCAERTESCSSADGCYQCHGYEAQGATPTGPRLGPQPLAFAAVLEIRPPAHRPDAAVHDQDRAGQRPGGHLRVSAVAAGAARGGRDCDAQVGRPFRAATGAESPALLQRGLMPISLSVNGRSPFSRRGSDDAAALRPERRPRTARPEVRLRPRTVRLLHGASSRALPFDRASRPCRPSPDAEITTLEGLGTVERPHAIQKAFIDEQAVQCGFCLSGVILTAKAALDRNPKATDAQIRQALSDVLCRCGTHTRMMKAIKRYHAGGAGMNRRDFLKTSGALIVVLLVDWRVASHRRRSRAASTVPGRRSSTRGSPSAPTATSPRTPAKSSSATASTPRRRSWSPRSCRVPLARVKLIQGDTGVAPDQGTTSGSQSHPVNFNEGAPRAGRRHGARSADADGVRAPGRAGRQLLACATASSASGPTPSKRCHVRRARRRDEVQPRAQSRTRSGSTRSEWTVLGKPVPRLDMPALATGTFEFVHNVRVPGMLHGRVVRPPEVGATLVSVDEGSVRGMPGFVKVVVKKNFVGVVAEKPWQATQIAAKLKARLDEGRRPAGAARLLPVPPEPAAVARQLHRQLEGRRRQLAGGREGGQGDVPACRTRCTGRSARRARSRTCRATRRRSGRRRSRCIRRATPPRCCSVCSRKRPRDLHDGRRLLRPERRRHRVVRRGADVAGGRQARCACSCRARTRWRGRTTARRT